MRNCVACTISKGNKMIFKSAQKGFSLFFVMILMLVIAFIVIMTSQSSLTEMRSSTNEADRKFALSLAENGLREGEFEIKKAFDAKPTVTTFTADCKNGWCLPAKDSYSSNQSNDPFKFDTAAAPDVPAWERCAANTSKQASSCVGKTVLDAGCDSKTNTRCKKSNDGRTFYIVEYLGARTDSTQSTQIDNFRITSRARGNNDDTVVTLQSYVELIQ